MRPNKLITNLFLLVVALGLIYFGYRHFSKSDSADQPALEPGGFATEQSVSTRVSDEFLDTLTGLQELNLDGAAFQSPVFQSLQDSSIVIPNQDPGRLNPFLPVNFRAPRPVATSTTTPSASTGGQSGASTGAAGGFEDLRAR